LISVIIPTLNEAENIERLLQSLQPLRQQGHEIIVVDGGSTDNTRALSAPLCDHHLQQLKGRARQMNAGAAIAQGDWLWFVHADSELPDALWQQFPASAQASSAWGWFQVKISASQPLLKLVAAMMNIRSRLSSVSTGDMGQFVSRKLFRQVGGFADMPLMEDIQLSKTLRKIQPPTVLPGPIVTSARRWQQQGVVRTIILMWRLRLLFWLGVPASRLQKSYEL